MTLGWNALRKARSLLVWHSCFFASFALAILAEASAQSLSADRRLENFIAVMQFASRYADAEVPTQWCYYRKTDRNNVRWYLADEVPDNLVAVKATGGFGIPFMVTSYDGAQSFGALVVGYVVEDGAPKAPIEPVLSFTSGASDCAMGMRILSDGPYPIVGLAKNLAKQTVVDPAPEYRVWAMKGGFHRVRLISAIPVAFEVGSRQVSGSIVLGFTGEW